MTRDPTTELASEFRRVAAPLRMTGLERPINTNLPHDPLLAEHLPQYLGGDVDHLGAGTLVVVFSGSGLGLAALVPRKPCVLQDLPANDGAASALLGEAAGQLADVGVVAALPFLVSGIVIAAEEAEDGESTADPAADLAESPPAAAEGGAELGEGGFVQPRQIGVGEKDGLGAAVAPQEVDAGEGGAGGDQELCWNITGSQ